MKIIIINASPRINGNCQLLTKEIKQTLDELSIEHEIISIGNLAIRGCMACGKCHQGLGKCVIDDIVNEASLKIKDANGLMIVSPVYYASPNGTLMAFLDRLFYSSNYSFKMKVGAAFCVARRAGTVSSFDVLNKYFTISGMPIVSGDYWNNGFGRREGEILKDLEGLRNARIVTKRMVFLMKAIEDGKKQYANLLEDEKHVSTHFIKNQE